MSAHPHVTLLTQFYEAFSRRDGAAMAACYHPDIRFSDPVFPGLVGPRAGGMWRMLCERGADLVVQASGIEADDTKGKAHWEAWYTFGTGKKVHNVIDATFTFKDGKIVGHTDTFDFHRWSKQALGLMGTLFGGTNFLRKKVSSTAMKQLDRYLEKHPG